MTKQEMPRGGVRRPISAPITVTMPNQTIDDRQEQRHDDQDDRCGIQQRAENQHQEHIGDHDGDEARVDLVEKGAELIGQAGKAEHTAVHGGRRDQEQDAGGDVAGFDQGLPEAFERDAPAQKSDDQRHRRAAGTRLDGGQPARIDTAEND